MNLFKFKQFSVKQDKAAMKIGTDGVLLGAWVNLNDKVNSILDVGTGTGLIALQLAQRSDVEIIDALEIEEQSFEQAVNNFENSDWSNHLFCYHTSLQKFAEEIDEKYDMIVSNPPFFESDNQIKNKARALARQKTALPYNDLLSCAIKLLSAKGSCAFIIPFDDEVLFLNLALKNNLYPLRITHVKGHKTTPVKRSLLQLSFIKTQTKINELVVEISRHVYTEAYKNLVKDFYLKM